MNTGDFKRWQCMLCAFVYDEATGMPDDGIAPGTPWAEVPETWTCPDCGAAKSEFEEIDL
jgi:rubredoxin